MMVPFVVLSAVCVLLLIMLGWLAVLFCRQSKEIALVNNTRDTWRDTADTWRETAERRAKELTTAWAQSAELHLALYLSDSEAHQATHEQAVDRAKRLASGWHVKAVDYFVDRLWKATGRKVEKSQEAIRKCLDEFCSQPNGLAVSESLRRLKEQYDELRDAINDVSPPLDSSDPELDNHQMLMGRLKGCLKRSVDFSKFSSKLHCAGFGITHNSLWFEMSGEELRDLATSHREKAAKWDELKKPGQPDAYSYFLSLLTEFGGVSYSENREEIVSQVKTLRWKSNGFDLAYKVLTGRDWYLDQYRQKEEARTTTHIAHDTTEPLSPAMGVGEVTKDDFHRAAVEKFKEGCVESRSIVFPTADSIENAPDDSLRGFVDRYCEQQAKKIATGFTLPADFKIDAVLARDKARSNSRG